PNDLKFVGLWQRTGSTLIDNAIVFALTAVPLHLQYGEAHWTRETVTVLGPLDFMVSYVLPTIAVIWFWRAKQATPGKMAIQAKIVNARTGQPPSTAQCIGRYLAYIPATLPLGLGLLWISFDSRKQGWHDKLARTVVVSPKTIIAPQIVTAKEVSFAES
ncbi:MAG: RDD family protein, partial [Cellvibrionales bacterium]|nr:RDD family protein [Cellvibrionales bacterium]